MNYQFRKMFKDMVVAYLKIPPWHLPGRTEKSNKESVSIAGPWANK
jgi:hypothetical protein